MRYAGREEQRSPGAPREEKGTRRRHRRNAIPGGIHKQSRSVASLAPVCCIVDGASSICCVEGAMDGVDGKVIGCLLRNARATLAEIGAEVGLSAPAVKRRIDRLVASGAIQGFTALIDPDVLGWQTEAYVELYCKGTVSPEDLRRSLERVPEVVGAV